MPVLKFVGFFALAAALVALVNVYVYRRCARAFALERRGRATVGVGLALGLVAMVGARAAERTLDATLADWLGIGASAVELAVLISCGLLLVVDAGRGVLALGRGLSRVRARRRAKLAARTRAAASVDQRSPAQVPEPETAPETAPKTTPKTAPALDDAEALARREFLTRAATGSALALGGGAAFYGAFFGRHAYHTETVPIRIPGLPRTLDGFTIVQISDIHFGVHARGDEVKVASALIHRARPDLVVVTGDLIDHDLAFTPYLGQLLARLRGAARHGIAVIPGNHDYYSGIDQVLATARRAGATVLLNEGRVIGDAGGAFALLGVDDLWMRREGGGPDLARAIAMVPRELPRILLCHNPAFFPEAAPRVALQLSGHTHGGQVNVGLGLAELVLPYGYVAGRYERGDSQLYVNRGFGTAGPPARVGSAPEITRIVLIAG